MYQRAAQAVAHMSWVYFHKYYQRCIGKQFVLQTHPPYIHIFLTFENFGVFCSDIQTF